MASVPLQIKQMLSALWDSATNTAVAPQQQAQLTAVPACCLTVSLVAAAVVVCAEVHADTALLRA